MSAFLPVRGRFSRALRVLTAMLCLLPLVAAGCGGAAAPAAPPPAQTEKPPSAPPQQPMDKVTLNLGWVPYGVMTPFYYGVKQGYFAQQHIDVTIHPGQGAVTTAQQVASGADTFAMVDYGSLAVAVAKGLPIKGVFAVVQQSPMAIFALPSANIKTLKDLEGKTLAISAGDALTQALPVLLKVNQVDPAKVKLNTVSPAAKMSVLLDKKVDAMTSFDMEQLPIAEAQGGKLDVLRYRDFGVNPLSLGLAVRNELITSNPDLVRRFVKAMAQSWADTVKDPKTVADTAASMAGPTAAESPFFYQQLMLTIPDLHTAATQGKPIGWNATEDWVTTINLLKETNQLSGDVKPEQLFTNDFLPQ